MTLFSKYTHRAKFAFVLIAILSLMSCGGGGGGGESERSTITSSTNTNPIISSFTASSTIIDTGENVELSWDSQNTAECEASGDWTGMKPFSGTEMVNPGNQSRTYIMECTGTNGAKTNPSSVSVTVNSTAPPVPTLVLSAKSTNIPFGGSTELEWNSTEATDCTASGDWSGKIQLSGKQTIGPLQQTKMYTLFCTGPGGNSPTRSVTVQVGTPPPNPTASLSSSSTSISSGDNVTLTWVSQDADSCSAVNGWTNKTDPNGSESVGPLTTTTTFTITCTGAGGNASASTTVNVIPVPAPTVSLTPSAASIDSGDNVTLTWVSQDADSCSAVNGWTNKTDPNGSESVGPLTTTTTFTITCTGIGGSTSASITVSVNPPSAPTVSLTPSAASIDSGDNVTLTWVSQDADSCSAVNGWTNKTDPNGSESVGPLTTTTTFTITCTGAGGNASASTTVNVIPVPAPTVSLTPSAASIDSGDNVTLTWVSQDADSCSAVNGWTNKTDPNGSESVGPLTTTTTFTITCTGAGGNASASTTVNVIPVPAPTVSLTPSAASIDSGDNVTLTWVSQDADSCSAVNGWTNKTDPNGSESVGPLTTTTTFTINCTGAGGNASASTTVSVIPVPPPELTFSANPSEINENETTTLQWSVTNADLCTASGDWNGKKAASSNQNTEIVGPLTQTSIYNLECNGPGGDTIKSVTVTVLPMALGSTNLSWTPPTTNTDNSPLNLGGFHIYQGTSANQLSKIHTITGQGIATYTVENLQPGTYFFVVTAYNTNGTESAFSNMESITIN